jgi:LmeA-like phospholipid-binding
MRRIGVVAVAGAILLVLVVAQLVLPGIAEQRLRDRLGRSGNVLSVEVHAFPAIELLWHHADRVVVRMARYRSSTGSLGRLLSEAGGVGSLDASAAQVDVGLLTARDATLRKRGDRLTGTARVTEADLRTAVPILQSVVPVASSDGRLMLRGTAALLGVSATVDATVRPQNGALVVVPDVPFGGLATITVFSDPHVEVDGVSERAAPDGFTVTATARLK